MLFQMRKENEVVKLLAEVFPDRMHVIETERYCAKGLEGPAPTVNEGNGRRTMHNLSEVQRNWRVRGRTKLHEQELTMNVNKNQVEGGGRAPEERGVGMVSLH